MFPGALVTNLRRWRTQASLARGLNFGKADLENYSVTRERLLRRDERFLGVVRASRRENRRSGGARGGFSVGTRRGCNCVCLRARPVEVQHRYEDGKLLENFPGVGTTYSDISIEPLSRATPRTSSFPRLKFSIFVPVYVSLSSPRFLPILPYCLPPNPIHDILSSRLSRQTMYHPRFRRSQTPARRKLEIFRPVKLHRAPLNALRYAGCFITIGILRRRQGSVSDCKNSIIVLRSLVEACGRCRNLWNKETDFVPSICQNSGFSERYIHLD